MLHTLLARRRAFEPSTTPAQIRIARPCSVRTDGLPGPHPFGHQRDLGGPPGMHGPEGKEVAHVADVGGHAESGPPPRAFCTALQQNAVDILTRETRSRGTESTF